MNSSSSSSSTSLAVLRGAIVGCVRWNFVAGAEYGVERNVVKKGLANAYHKRELIRDIDFGLI